MVYVSDDDGIRRGEKMRRREREGGVPQYHEPPH